MEFLNGFSMASWLIHVAQCVVAVRSAFRTHLARPFCSHFGTARSPSRAHLGRSLPRVYKGAPPCRRMAPTSSRPLLGLRIRPRRVPSVPSVAPLPHDFCSDI